MSQLFHQFDNCEKTQRRNNPRITYTIEQNGGASDLLLESLNPRGCAERTSELRL